MKTIELRITVQEWVSTPLYKLMNMHANRHAMEGNYDSPEFRKLDRKGQSEYIKRAGKEWLRKHKVITYLEESSKGLKRPVKSWDQLSREMYLIETSHVYWQNGSKVQAAEMFKLSSYKLNNIKMLYMRYMSPVEIYIKVTPQDDRESLAKRLESLRQSLIEPAYAQRRLAHGKESKIDLYYQYGSKPIHIETYNPEQYDDRPTLRVLDEESNQHFFTKGKKQEPTDYIGVYTEDIELMGDLVTFHEFAQRLVEASNEYQGDVEQAKKDLKNYYYSSKEVQKALKQQYKRQINKLSMEQAHKTVDFNTFVETLKSYEDAPLDEYPLCEILEDYMDELQ